MVLLRPTLKLRTILPASSGDDARSDTALGDWYASRIVVQRRPLLLLVCSGSLLAVLTPAREVRGLPSRLADLVAQRLGRLGIARILIDPEMKTMEPVGIAKTVDRSVLGIMVDYAKMLTYDLDPGFSDVAELQAAEEFLWDKPCHAGRSGDGAIWPRRKTLDLLQARWQAG